MKTKIKIEKVFTKSVATKFGNKDKLSFLADNKWYSAWKDAVNSQWKAGDEIEIDYTSRIFEGKEYFDIIMPKKEDVISNALKDINNKLDLILSKIQTTEEPF